MQETLERSAAMTSLDAFDQQRPMLFGIAYRMLGSVMDAEDIVQEAYLRWQSVEPESIDSPKAFLCTIVTRLSIDQLRTAKKRREVYAGEWLPEPLISDAPSPSDSAELADSLSTAFLLLLESLSPHERAVFLLKDVFEYNFNEIAEIVGKNPANCRQMAKRARDRVAARVPRFEVDAAEQERILAGFLEATATGDVDTLIATLAEDAEFHNDHGGKAAAAKRVIYGASKIARFLVGITKRFLPENVEVRIMTINGRPGVASFVGDQPESVFTVDIVDGKITRLYAVRNPDKLKTLAAHLARD